MPIQDDILPLTKPIVGASGRVYKEVPVPKGTAINVSIAAYNMCALFLLATTIPLGRALNGFLVTETRICGVQTLISSDRSVGSRCLTRQNRPLGYMGTCTVPNAVAGTLNTDPHTHTAARSPGVLGAASGGGLRALIVSFVLPKVLKTTYSTASSKCKRS